MREDATAPPHPLNILVVEDDREMRHLFSVVLGGEGRSVLTAATGAEGEAILAEQDVDLLVLDLILPDMDGRSLLSRLRRDRRTAALPVVCVTARVSAEIRADCFARGADAFVEKPLDPSSFAADVNSILERAAAREQQGQRDDLTGLLNRAGLLEFLEAQASPGDWIVALEVDGMRRISDRWGWGTGERILYEVAQALEAAVPEGGVLGRWGAGEFVLLLGEDGDAAARALVDTVRALPVEGPDRETFHLTASAGVARVWAEGTPADALDEAQRRLGAAQRAGGNRVVEADEGSGADPARVLVAEDDDITATILTHRLEKEGFEVVRFDNGVDAYEGALTETPTLVLLDIKMPGMDGFEVLERLRKTPAYADVPIVILSSMGSESDIIRGFELGADDYVLKPFSPAELIARVRRLLGRKTTPAEA